MTLSEIKAALDKAGFPVAYHHFAVGKAPGLPYVVYTAGERQIGADNAVHIEVHKIRVEVYTDQKDPAAVDKVKKAMLDAGLFYRHDGEFYIESEKMYLNAYESEVVK